MASENPPVIPNEDKQMKPHFFSGFKKKKNLITVFFEAFRALLCENYKIYSINVTVLEMILYINGNW